MDVNIEDVMVHVEALRELDTIPFENLNFFKNGKSIDVTADVKDAWRFVGLSNTSFIKDVLVAQNITGIALRKTGTYPTYQVTMENNPK